MLKFIKISYLVYNSMGDCFSICLEQNCHRHWKKIAAWCCAFVRWGKRVVMDIESCKSGTDLLFLFQYTRVTAFCIKKLLPFCLLQLCESQIEVARQTNVSHGIVLLTKTFQSAEDRQRSGRPEITTVPQGFRIRVHHLYHLTCLDWNSNRPEWTSGSWFKRWETTCTSCCATPLSTSVPCLVPECTGIEVEKLAARRIQRVSSWWNMMDRCVLTGATMDRCQNPRLPIWQI